jgi:hypothetical protein
VLFFEHVKNCKLHKTKPGSFFAQLNHLIKTELQKHSTDPPEADQSQYKAYTRSLSFNLQTHSGAELMQVFFPATLQGTSSVDGGSPEDTSSPPSAPAVAAETDPEAWLRDPSNSYAS